MTMNQSEDRSAMGIAKEDQNSTAGITLQKVSILDVAPFRTINTSYQNERYRRLKTSILAAGRLVEPLTVVKRPGDDHYTSSGPGNASLQICKQLYENDPSQASGFEYIWVIVRPYISELDLAIKQAGADERRKDLSFYERCLGQYTQFDAFCQEQNVGRRQSVFIEFMAQKWGVSIDKGALSRSIWVVERMWPLIPTSLSIGEMSYSGARALQSYLAGVKNVWLERDCGTPEDFDIVVNVLLGRQEKEHLEMLNYADGQSDSQVDLTIDYSQLQDEFAREIAVSCEDEDVTSAIASRWIEGSVRSDNSDAASATQKPDRGHAAPKQNNDPAASGPTETVRMRIRKLAPSPATARINAREIATKLALDYGFERLIGKTEYGLGFLLTDLPIEYDNLDKNEDENASHAVWLALAMSCGVFEIPTRLLSKEMGKSSVLRAAIESGSVLLVQRSLMGNKSGLMTHLINTLQNSEFDAFVTLMRLRREISGTEQRTADFWSQEDTPCKVRGKT